MALSPRPGRAAVTRPRAASAQGRGQRAGSERAVRPMAEEVGTLTAAPALGEEAAEKAAS